MHIYKALSKARDYIWPGLFGMNVVELSCVRERFSLRECECACLHMFSCERMNSCVRIWVRLIASSMRRDSALHETFCRAVMWIALSSTMPELLFSWLELSGWISLTPKASMCSPSQLLRGFNASQIHDVGTHFTNCRMYDQQWGHVLLFLFFSHNKQFVESTKHF